ncbi:phosphatases II [Coniophora puteana RWD-64-598 SS2]|uniref:protein-tyrosine-phosphatase n=1 Tax=Coniophora puteana (strain RWD-64-598) TaxID=741705 RepID=A0A5M3N075_CONPW|nr:phosphatases II [Coniophora puteana RWD-64-598 SS2]EIW84657.1 phosphatases II [Coniophora puteana RWD-64-598 SS2]
MQLGKLSMPSAPSSRYFPPLSAPPTLSMSISTTLPPAPVPSHTGRPPALSCASIPPPTPRPPRAHGPSEIIPRLYMSDLAVAESAPALAALGITHVVSAMRGHVALPKDDPVLLSTLGGGAGAGIVHAVVPLDDLPFSELAAHLPAATHFIRGALRDPRARVLVHCAEGISRSASVVAAVLIAEYGWEAERAVMFVKSRRLGAEPNVGFVKQLQEYADSLKKCGAFPASRPASGVAFGS